MGKMKARSYKEMDVQKGLGAKSFMINNCLLAFPPNKCHRKKIPQMC